MTGLFLAVGYLLGRETGMSSPSGGRRHHLFAYLNADKMVLRIACGKKLAAPRRRSFMISCGSWRRAQFAYG